MGVYPHITEHPEDITVINNEPVTLNCAATGDPPPTIEWYKDGKHIHKTPAARIVQLSGSLFFLRTQHSKYDNDSGVYWCLARNSVGIVRSKNATLKIASKVEN